MNASRKCTPLFLAISLALALASCVQTQDVRGNFIDLEKLKKIRESHPTKADILREFGPPSADTTFQSNKWYYIGEIVKTWAFLAPDVQERHIVIFTFDDEDNVKTTEVRGAEAGREIPLVSRKTPDVSHKDSAIKDIFGNVGKIHKGTVASSR